MYNEDKKLITEITRKNNMDENLAKFADAVMTADFEYACQKFALNYVVIRELMADKDFAEDPYIYECVMGINKLVGTYLAGDADQLDDKDLALISEMRNKITEKMKVLTAYTDAFELYEYILNRKEYGFEENVDEELEKMFEEFDAEQFSAEVFNFIFADKDKVAVNAKIQQIVGQLPLRMTKARFYDIIGQTLSIYNGCEISSLDDFIETVEETALLQLPEKFETEYSSLHEAYEIIKEGDYAHLDFDGYRNLSTVLDKSAGFINDVVSDYMMLIELVNDLYSMMLAAECKSGVSESCMRALSIIRRIYESMENEDEFPTDAYDMLVANEGAQEEAKKLGVTVTFMSPNTKDDAQQIECVNNAVSAGAQAIIVAANGPDAISSALREASDAGVKLIYVDSPANVSAEATFSTDNNAAGKTAGEEMKKALADAGVTSGSIGIINVNAATDSCVMREEGFRSAFEGTDFELLETQYGEGDAAKSQSIAENYITQGVVGIFGCNEGSTTGAGNAIKASGKDNVIGVGFVKSDAILGLIDDGYLLCTMAQNPDVMGYEGVKAAVKAINGESLGGAVTDTGVSVLTKQQ